MKDAGSAGRTHEPRPASQGGYVTPLLAQWFHTWGTPAFVVLADLAVIAANAEGRRVLEAQGDIQLSGNRLWLPHAAEMERFRAFLASVKEHPKVWPLARSDGKGFWVLRAERMSAPDLPEAFNLLLTSSADRPPRFWADLSVPFQLTPSEDRVARYLFEGYTATELASAMGITVETARTYIRRIYQKTGASSREKLLSALSPFQTH